MSWFDELPGTASVGRTVAEGDVYLFTGMTGDLSPVHLDREYMRRTKVGERIVPGGLLLGMMSGASSKWCTKAQFEALSYGYDRVRFLRPVPIGETVTASFTPDSEVPEKRQLLGRLELHNTKGELVAVATHVLQRLEVDDGPSADAA